jgi:hypothetical protein
MKNQLMAIQTHLDAFREVPPWDKLKLSAHAVPWSILKSKIKYGIPLILILVDIFT